MFKWPEKCFLKAIFLLKIIVTFQIAVMNSSKKVENNELYKCVCVKAMFNI